MTDSKPIIKSEKTPSEPAKPRARRGGGRSGSKGGKSTGSTATSKKAPASAAFVGTCKKELAGKVIIYSEGRAAMASQWINFESAVYNAAGKVDAYLARAIANKQPLTLADFLVPDTDYSSEYTSIGADGTDVIDSKKKALYDKAEELMVDKSVSNYSTYLKNWETFFFRIKAQIDKETTSRLEMNTEWPKIKAKSNAGGLMRLIQTVCVHGTDRDYIPERVINCFATLLNSKQGKATPSEFSETMTSNHQVLIDVLGVNVFGMIPILQEFVIDRYDDFNFRFENLGSQGTEAKALVSQRCVDCILGCNMTLRSNKESSDMNAEVHKSLLSKHGDAFAMNTSEAVDQMIGFEALKRTSPKQAKQQASGDTSSAIMLLGVSNPNSDKFLCYNCGEEGHSQYKCPQLSKKEKQALYTQNYTDSSTGQDAEDKVEKAVLFVLGGEYSDNDSDTDYADAEQGSDADEPAHNEATEHDSIDSDNEQVSDGDDADDDVIHIDDEPRYDEESGEVVKSFVLCQISDTDEISFTSDDEHQENDSVKNVTPAPTTSSADHDSPSYERGEIIRVLTNVAHAQRKNNPHAWANAVAYKLSLVGINTTTLLQVSIPHLNSRLRREGQSAFHNTTLGGLSVEVARANSGDRTVIPDFCQGRA